MLSLSIALPWTNSVCTVSVVLIVQKVIFLVFKMHQRERLPVFEVPQLLFPNLPGREPKGSLPYCLASILYCE